MNPHHGQTESGVMCSEGRGEPPLQFPERFPGPWRIWDTNDNAARRTLIGWKYRPVWIKTPMGMIPAELPHDVAEFIVKLANQVQS